MKIMNCRECGKCNKKGKPSVIKESIYCKSLKYHSFIKLTMFQIFKNKLLGIATSDIEHVKKVKGFRDNYYMR